MDQKRIETLGPAERILQTLTGIVDHMVHNRPGIVIPDQGSPVGAKWEPASWKEEGEPKVKVVYKLSKVGKKSIRTRVGVLGIDGKVKENNQVVARFQMPGIFPEVAAYVYGQIAEVYKLDNEFAARWASWAFAQDNRDLKTALAAFMLVQGRKGEPVKGTDGKIEFHDDDFRDVGEAMFLLRDGKKDLNPKLLIRVGDLLALPQVAAINRDLGFGKSAREPFMGRYSKAIQKWLRFRENNPRMLEGLVKAGFRSTVKRLCARIGYKPGSLGFFQALRWKQKQSKDGRRGMAIGAEVAQAESWEGLTERQICNRIKKDKPNWKRIVGMLPATVGVTRAIMACAIEAGGLSHSDLIILTPTLEELGLLQDPGVSAQWTEATKKATDQRAANIAQRVRKTETAEKLQDVADKATAKALEEVTRGLRVYCVVDKSGSMHNSLEAAKGYLTRLLVGFPLDRLHVSVFNTVGAEVTLKAASAAAVAQAFKGHTAGGGTYYHEGVQALAGHKPGPDEDALFLFIGDEGESNNPRLAETIRQMGVNPVAFGLLKVPGQDGEIVRWTALQMGIPCFDISEKMFEGQDAYAIPRILRHLIASTPVKAAARRAVQKTLVEEILRTELLAKPAWAA